MNIANLPHDACCGCSACASVCPCDAIRMASDGQGFLYPDVDEKKCTQCGLCLKVCEGADVQKKEPLVAYAAKNKDTAVLKRSSSGGVSHGLIQRMIEMHGVVYGVAYDADHTVVTRRALTLDDCEAFYGSKYVQTNPGNTFKQVYTDLKEGTPVLYFGTSCHISGLLSYLQQKHVDMNRLITVDLICHGVPSPGLFMDYIGFLKRAPGFRRFEFRTKELPWGYGSRNYGCTVYYEGKKRKTDSLNSRLFLNLFFSNNCLRPSCYVCKYASLDKPADITIADYWGLADHHPDFFSEDGVSAVVIHTEKGCDFFKAAEELSYIESTKEAIAKKQGNVGAPSPKSLNYDAFWKLYEEKGFAAVAKRYGGLNMRNRVKCVLHKLKILE